MVQSPWEANWFATSQETPRISRNPKVHYRTHNRPPPVSILGQPDPDHTPTSHLLEIHPNIIHPSRPRSPQWYLSLRFPHQNPVHASPLPHRRYISCPSHPFRFYHPHNIGWGVQTMKFLTDCVPHKSNSIHPFNADISLYTDLYLLGLLAVRPWLESDTYSSDGYCRKRKKERSLHLMCRVSVVRVFVIHLFAICVPFAPHTGCEYKITSVSLIDCGQPASVKQV